MDVISILALIFAVVVLVKLTVVLINPQAWLKFTGPIWENHNLTLVIYLLASVVVGYFLLQELTIIQISAVMLFASLLISVGFIAYPKLFFSIKKEIVYASGAKILQENWITVVVWGVLALWTLWAIFY